MSRVLTIAIYSVLIILVFLFFGSLFKSCGNKAADVVGDTADLAVENIESAGETIVAVAENASDEFEGDEMNDESETESYGSDDSGSAYDNDSGSDYDSGSGYEADDQVTEEEDEAYTAEDKAPSSSSSSSGGSYGSHMVIAGNYSLEANADKMVRKLRDMGFDNAKKSVFNGSSYHTVIAGYYNGSSEASSSANSLKSSGIDCYVKRRG